MERLNAEKMEEWEKMTQEEQFFTYAENKYKECRVTYPVINSEVEGGEPMDTGC